MIQKEILTAPKVNESLLYGVGYKPFTVGAYYFIMKELKLSQQGKYKNKYVALIDDEDFQRLSQFRWSVFIVNHYVYAKTQFITNGKGITVLLHRMVMNEPMGFEIDHIDKNGLNCQKYNLRISTHAQNQSNRKASGESKYLGVHIIHNKNKEPRYTATITHNNRGIYLGTFTNEFDAALNYDRAARKYHGEFANLNFK